MKKTNCLIIKRQNVLEADRLLTVITEDYGKLKVVAKSSRKINSKLAGHLEPFTLSALNIVEGKNFGIVTYARIKRVFGINQNDLNTIATAYLIMEAVDKLIPLEQKNTLVFDLLVECFEAIEESTDLEMVKLYFLLKLLIYTGHKPNLSIKSDSSSYFFDIENGEITVITSSHSMPIKKNLIKLWRLIVDSSLSQLSKLIINDSTTSDSVYLIKKFYSYHFDIVFKSTSILK